MKRRDFLDPRRLAHAAGHAAHVISALEETALSSERPAVENLALVRFARRAMATNFEALLPLGTPAALEAAEKALDEIDRLEAQLSVYRDSSEVSRLNQGAAYKPIPVEAKLFELLELSARLHAETDGAFDISVGALIKAWGFYRRRGRVPSDEERAQVMTRVGMSHVTLVAAKRTVHYQRAGLEINLGSIGKGYALDRAAQILRSECDITAGLIHGGQSSVLALGTQPGEPRGWPIAIRHPWQPERRLAQVWLSDQALGTSAATFQHLEYNGRKLGHLLDPRSGWPVEGMASATAIAPTAAAADALATAFFVLGVDKTRAYCQAHPGVAAVLLTEGSEEPIVIGPS
jgi:thiamine biosynthesis lipoprotein